MRALAVVALCSLSGCASFFSGPVPLHDSVSVRVTLVDNVPGGYTGRAFWLGDQCDVILRRDTYPRCLQHEVRHCFEGAFHGDAPSSDDCFDH